MFWANGLPPPPQSPHPWPKIYRTPMVKVKCPDPGVASHNQKPDMGIVSGIKSPPLARTPPSRDLH